MNGILGDTAVINGAISPELDVKNEVIRLRLLNGSNARDYKFNFNDNNEFNQIASDGGFLEERDRKSTRLNSSHVAISYAVFCLKKKKHTNPNMIEARCALYSYAI